MSDVKVTMETVDNFYLLLFRMSRVDSCPLKMSRVDSCYLRITDVLKIFQAPKAIIVPESQGPVMFRSGREWFVVNEKKMVILTGAEAVRYEQGLMPVSAQLKTCKAVPTTDHEHFLLF